MFQKKKNIFLRKNISHDMRDKNFNNLCESFALALVQSLSTILSSIAVCRGEIDTRPVHGSKLTIATITLDLCIVSRCDPGSDLVACRLTTYRHRITARAAPARAKRKIEQSVKLIKS